MNDSGVKLCRKCEAQTFNLKSKKNIFWTAGGVSCLTFLPSFFREDDDDEDDEDEESEEEESPVKVSSYAARFASSPLMKL